jgi:hypothetical protein
LPAPVNATCACVEPTWEHLLIANQTYADLEARWLKTADDRRMRIIVLARLRTEPKLIPTESL